MVLKYCCFNQLYFKCEFQQYNNLGIQEIVKNFQFSECKQGNIIKGCFGCFITIINFFLFLALCNEMLLPFMIHEMCHDGVSAVNTGFEQTRGQHSKDVQMAVKVKERLVSKVLLLVLKTLIQLHNISGVFSLSIICLVVFRASCGNDKMDRWYNCLNPMLSRITQALQGLFVALQFRRRMAIIRRVAGTSKMFLSAS